MPTRYNAHKKSTNRFGVSPLSSGYEPGSSSNDFTIPSVGIVDMDRALFNLFDKEIPLMTETNDGIKRIPIVFASGEKWAILKSGIPRDKKGALIIPAIVIGRTNITQDLASDITGRGINQNTGTIEIKRRLNVTNREYQNLINRLLLKNQSNVALNEDDDLLSDQVSTGREIGDLSDDPTVLDGGLLLGDKRKEIFETIVIPQPQFFTATYEVIAWCQYVQQMNSVIEGLIKSFLPQGNQWRIDTDKGYWFVASVDGNVYNAQNNFENMATEERMIKYQFNITVPGYMLIGEQPGQPIAIKRHVSNPTISFAISTQDPEQQLDAGSVIEPFLGSDDPTLPSALKSNRRDQRETADSLLYKTGEHDPAKTTQSRHRGPGSYKTINGVNSKGEKVKKYVKVKNINAHTGETIYSTSFDLDGISITSIDD